MLIICYNDPDIANVTHRNLYDTCQTLEEFREKHPETEPTYVFDTKDEIRTTEKERIDHFQEHCGAYGFFPSDFGQTVPTNRGDARFVGFRPKNRRYKCILQMEGTDLQIKATPEYVRKRLRSYTA